MSIDESSTTQDDLANAEYLETFLSGTTSTASIIENNISTASTDSIRENNTQFETLSIAAESLLDITVPSSAVWSCLVCGEETVTTTAIECS